ncbi:MAG: large conductance mechanosensitive channel protein MscL [Bryobacteraceae bacterium]
MFDEFKKFALGGNVLDMAVGIIMGGAFGPIVSGLVEKIIMPVVGQFAGGMDFKDMFIALAGSPATLAEATKNNVPVIAYGAWFNTIINFLIIAFCMFLLAKASNKMKKAEPPPPPPAPPKEEVLLGEIRDLLKTRAAGAGN